MDILKTITDRIHLFARGETLTCADCGRKYVSRGKKDPGICRVCEVKHNYIGGPLDNQGENNDNS